MILLIIVVIPFVLLDFYIFYFIDLYDDMKYERKKKKAEKVKKQAEEKMFKMIMTKVNNSQTPIHDIDYMVIWAAEHNCMHLLDLLLKEGSCAYDELFEMAVQKYDYKLLNYLFSLNMTSESCVISMIDKIDTILKMNEHETREDCKLSKQQKEEYKRMKKYLKQYI